jgi:hypothetical protein
MNAGKALFLGSMLALLVPVVMAADAAADSSVGTWKLNVAKSTFGSGTVPKSETRTYSATSLGTHLVIEGEDSAGKKSKTELLLTYDGQPQKVAGNGDFDAVSTKRLDKYETTADLYKGGKVVGSVRRLVAKDGKSMTINQKVLKPDGSTETSLGLYERQ